MEKAPSEYLIEYLRPVQSWIPKLRVGRWKNVVPVGPALFPDIAIEISDMAADTAQCVTNWMDCIYTILTYEYARGKYSFRLTDEERKIVVAYSECRDAGNVSEDSEEL